MLGRPPEEEALRLALAFYCILESEKRAELLKLADRFARESQTVDGLRHYLEMKRNKDDTGDATLA